MCVCMYDVCMYVIMYVCMCMYVIMYVCMYVCMYTLALISNQTVYTTFSFS